MQKIHYLLTFVGFAALGLTACNTLNETEPFEYEYYYKEDYAMMSEYLNIPELPYKYNDDLSAVGLFIDPKSVEPAHVVLGRVLFYDKHLSKDGTISCASCHKQEAAFGDDVAFSKGVQERQGDRNSIALMSVASFSAQYGGGNSFGGGGKRFFWDNRAGSAAEQAAESMANPKEMDMSMTEIVNAVNAQPYYRPLFRKAFGYEQANEERVLQAVSSFVNAMGSTSSTFDAAIADARTRGVDPSFSNLPLLTTEQNQGKTLFINNCASCHTLENIFVPDQLFLDHASNGLDANPTDVGVFKFSNLDSDKGTFKVPSLRNITVTGPYMHDGRFTTLEQVMDHYSNGIQNHANLHPKLRNTDGSPKQMNFTPSERSALLAFLGTMTDTKKMADERFADPFKR
jgi:cytochrome c peroxidase